MIGPVLVLTGMMVCGALWWSGHTIESRAGLGLMVVGVMISLYEVFTYKHTRDTLSSPPE